MGYLEFIEITPEGVTTKDVSELSFSDTIETLLALGALETKLVIRCGSCLAEKDFDTICECQK